MQKVYTGNNEVLHYIAVSKCNRVVQEFKKK